MAYTTNSERIKNAEAMLDDHGKILSDQNAELKKQKELTYFFTVIVAITLVGALVGAFGVYVAVIQNLKNCSKDDNHQTTQRQIDELVSQYAILRVKNPYLK